MIQLVEEVKAGMCVKRGQQYIADETKIRCHFANYTSAFTSLVHKNPVLVVAFASLEELGLARLDVVTWARKEAIYYIRVEYYDVGAHRGGLRGSEKPDRLVFRNVTASTSTAAETLVAQAIRRALVTNGIACPDHLLWEPNIYAAPALQEGMYTVFASVFGLENAKQVVSTVHGTRGEGGAPPWLVLGNGTLQYCSTCGERGHLPNTCGFFIRVDLPPNKVMYKKFCDMLQEGTKAKAVYSGNTPQNKKWKSWGLLEFRTSDELIGALSYVSDLWLKERVLIREPIISDKGVPESCNGCGLLDRDCEVGSDKQWHRTVNGRCLARRGDRFRANGQERTNQTGREEREQQQRPPQQGGGQHF
jgi:hypothetical protein